VIIGVRLSVPLAASETKRIPVALRQRNAIPDAQRMVRGTRAQPYPPPPNLTVTWLEQF